MGPPQISCQSIRCLCTPPGTAGPPGQSEAVPAERLHRRPVQPGAAFLKQRIDDLRDCNQKTYSSHRKPPDGVPFDPLDPSPLVELI